ncbi:MULTISPECIES: hypothetical protein [unclassified Streptomyces]|uniref:hypothetical protein n=1 Tax=unclassified Streptomyces TaxID=2593676 RepID=UPI00202F243D|nr:MULTISPECIES: hypothetical protein [unclassified Streptomyces]MCM1967539.1 hypothetical protein [Streptomyces sp. G1]MCX5126039.1 hypothetical protein [Streptomyces sp. NBC_00347]MCX5298162.1 hypothetical protein [Streptomyces sp. NBC_00193]
MNSLAQIYDREFRVRGLRQQGWGRGLLATAALIWLWMGYLLVFPFSIDRGGDSKPVECESRAFHQDSRTFAVSYAKDDGERCDAERDWGPILAALLLSLPLASVGTGLYVSGASAVRTAAYAAEITRLNATKEL